MGLFIAFLPGTEREVFVCVSSNVCGNIRAYVCQGKSENIICMYYYYYEYLNERIQGNHCNLATGMFEQYVHCE